MIKQNVKSHTAAKLQSNNVRFWFPLTFCPQKKQN